MAYFSILYNLRDNPRSDLLFVARQIYKYDRYKLGTFDKDTRRHLTFAEFHKEFNQELKAHNTTAKELLWDGDPSKESKFTASGQFRSSYLK